MRRPEQVVLQTMHGTPLKTFGLDIKDEITNDAEREAFIAKNANWDYLLVQGIFMENKAESCFGVKTPLLRCGYPRTDKLFHVTPKQVESLKERLGLPKDKKIILYAPTWRVRNKFEMKLDVDLMREALSDEYVLLIRLHSFVANVPVKEDREFVFDVTKYQYVEDLYLISDILITDYSSLMFDYSLLDRPMLFYTYDYDEYAGQLRGIYVDFKKEAPGPLLYDTVEVVNAIKRKKWNDLRYRQKVRRFKKKYLTYENGDSMSTVLKEVFGIDVNHE